ncbi:MAG: N-ethylammeline chlorohydrolase [Bacillota bacterium]|nr:N-ethylammeline chlorohydrolase [Bacillota bacterium]
MFDTVIAGGIILSSHNGYQPFVGSIGINDGIIVHVSDRILDRNDGKEFVDASGRIIMPGLINGHCHGDMAFAKGFGGGMTLKEQMEAFGEVGWFYADITDEERYYARMQTYCEAMLSGTTTLVENMFWSLGERSPKAFRTVGMRGAPAEDVRYDFQKSDTFLTDQMLAEFNASCKGNNCIPILGTLPEEEFTDYRLKETARILAESGVLYTSHLAETRWRYESAASRFGMSPVKVLHEYQLLNERYIGSHGIYFDDEDIRVLAETGVKIVNTPICEQKIADGAAPIRRLLDHGITVGLGTDGAMWNNSNDLFREMKCMAIVHNIRDGANAFTPGEILDMATIGGARVLGLEHKLGTLEEGKLADMILVDAEAPHMTPIHFGEWENVTSNLVFCATGADVTDVMIQGEFKIRNRKILTCNVKEIQRSVQETSNHMIHILRRINE